MWSLPDTLLELEESGDEGLVLELIDSYQADTSRRIESLHAAIAKCDAATVKAEAHCMRGSSSQMGAEALAHLFEAVETGAPRMNWPELAAFSKQAQATYDEVRLEMADFLQGRQVLGGSLQG